MQHVFQSKVNSCIAACVVMVRNALGEDISEEDVFDEWGDVPNKGYDFYKPRTLTNAKLLRLYLDEEGALQTLEAMLQDHLAICIVRGGPMTVFYQKHTPELISPYGVLCTRFADHDALMGCPLPHHAIVLTGYSNETITFFDPYHDEEHQPLLMSAEHLACSEIGIFYFFARV